MTHPTESQFTGKQVLLERGVELGAVEELIAGVGRGGRLLAIEGPPGIGKTALLAEGKELARTGGLRVLSARGLELERSFAYGVVRQLFEPLLASEPADARAGLLAGTAELAAPVFDPAQVALGPASDSSLATLHGLYWLTVNLVEREPLLLVIDDLQWSDLASLRWLAYLLPRMEGLELLVLLGLRPEEPGVDQALVGQVLSDPLAAILRPAAVTGDGTARLVRERLSAEVEDAFCSACHLETGGNPFLLGELVREIAAEGLAPIASNASRVPETAARAGTRAVSLRLARLPAGATSLAQAVAVLGDDADPRLAGALAGLDGQSVSDAAADLARVDVLGPQAPLGFVHPLIRAAVYEAIAPGERERAHARAARLLLDDGAEPERIAAHLLRSPSSQDSEMLAVLRDAARRARSRGTSESAVGYLRRALLEPPADANRGELLAELGSVEAQVEGEAAIEHLRAARGLAEDRVRRAEIALVLGRQLFFLHDDEAEAVYTTALDDLAGADPELARLLEAGLIHAELFVPSGHEHARMRLEQVRDHPADGTVGEKLLLSLLAFHDAVSGAPADEVIPVARRALAEGELVRSDISAAVLPLCTVLAMGDLDEVLVLFEVVLAEAHRRGSMSDFAAAKVFRAQAMLWRGDLD